MPEIELQQRVAAVRRFNRLYTRQIGLLEERLLRTPHSLGEARVLYELAQRGTTTATEIGKELGLDAGYLSRILRNLGDQGLVRKQRSEADARRSPLSLTSTGRKAFARLDSASRREIQAMLSRFEPEDQARLLAAMETIEAILGSAAGQRVPYLLRTHRPGDMGWVVQSHGALYAREYGWDESFEALVAEIVAKFLRELDPRRERCWIAEREGENVGSVFLVRESEGVARLRLLLVTPKARGLGIGARLVAECERFARDVGYRKIVLWTNGVLDSAGKIYEASSYLLVHEEAHHSFGHDLVGQTWEKELRAT